MGQFDALSRHFSPHLSLDMYRQSAGLALGLAGMMLAGAVAVNRCEDRVAPRD